MTAGLRVIAFTVRWLPDQRVHDIVPTIDGQSLLDLIDRFELDSGMRPAGGAYGGLIPAFFRYGPLDEHFLGKENPGLGPKTAVLGCECGEVGCWPLMARIVPTGNPHVPPRRTSTASQLRVREHLHWHNLRVRWLTRPNNAIRARSPEPRHIASPHIIRVQQGLILHPPTKHGVTRVARILQDRANRAALPAIGQSPAVATGTPRPPMSGTCVSAGSPSSNRL